MTPEEAAHLQYLRCCKSCWWQEGGKCFDPGTFEPLPNGDSSKLADGVCENYEGKRGLLQSLLGDVKLIILSEENAKRAEEHDG